MQEKSKVNKCKGEIIINIISIIHAKERVKIILPFAEKKNSEDTKGIKEKAYSRVYFYKCAFYTVCVVSTTIAATRMIDLLIAAAAKTTGCTSGCSFLRLRDRRR